MRPTSMPSSWCDSREELGIDLVGPPRPNPSWQGKVEGGHTLDRFEVDWDEQRVRCPQGKLSSAWSRQVDHAGAPYVSVMFRKADCAACAARPLCTRAAHQARHLKLPPRAEHEALRAARERLATKEGRRLLRAAGRDRGHPLARGTRLRAAPQPLSWAGQNPPAACGDRGRAQPRAPRRLVPGGPARRHAHLTLRRTRRLSRLRQRYPAVFGVKLVSRQYWCGAWR